jgi:hypothetical protein
MPQHLTSTYGADITIASFAMATDEELDADNDSTIGDIQ